MRHLDLFAGVGGWELGARLSGFDGESLGIEIDPVPTRVAQAAGHTAFVGDVAALDPHEFGPVDLLTGSPPCQSFSQGGKRKGLDDPRGQLVHEPLRWAMALRPRAVALEQVPGVLPIWREHAAALSTVGYSAWAGILDAADFEVPQVRKRAILIARRDGVEAAPPPPVGPRVTMAQALGWGMTARPYFTLAAARTTGGPDKEKVGGSGARAGLYAERAAGRWIDPPVPEPDGAIRVRIEDAALLQGFPRGYPWAGTMTQQYRQISNAMPPPLATAVLADLVVRTESEVAA